MSAADRRAFGRTGLEVSPVGIGTAAWGSAGPALFDLEVPVEESAAAARRVLAGPLNLMDTSNNYSDGESERRIGAVLREDGGLPQGFVLQTKLDRDPTTGSFGADRMRRSLDESLERLGVDRVPVLYLHDPENGSFDELLEPGGAVDVLLHAKREGTAAAVGISGGPVTLIHRFVETDLFDAVITHNRYTLVDRTARALIDAAAARGMAVVNAAVYGSGLLARWPRTTTRYHYTDADPRTLDAVDLMGAACDRHGVSLAAAALQFSVREPGITATICGVLRADEVDEAIANLDRPIPDQLWAELEELVPDRDAWVGD
jgi:D-threo-aldose 1-dehydrogenase